MSSRWFKLVILPLTLAVAIIFVVYGLFVRNSGVAAALAEGQQAKEACDALDMPYTAYDMNRLHNISPEGNAGPTVRKVLAKFESKILAAKKLFPHRLDEYLSKSGGVDFSKWQQEYSFVADLWKELESVKNLKRCRFPHDFKTNPLADNTLRPALHYLHRAHIRSAVLFVRDKKFERATTELQRAFWIYERIADTNIYLSGPSSEESLRWEQLKFAKSAASDPQAKNILEEELNWILNDRLTPIDAKPVFQYEHFVGLAFLEDPLLVEKELSTNNNQKLLKKIRLLGGLPDVRRAWISRHQSAIAKVFETIAKKPVENSDQVYDLMNAFTRSRISNDQSGLFWTLMNPQYGKSSLHLQIRSLENDLRKVLEEK